MPRVDNNRRVQVAIVGGGLAGLSAAHALAATPGAQVTLFEARRQVGGRAGSFVDPASGEVVDYCQHVAMGCCTNLLDLLRDCDLLDQWRRVTQWPFLHPRVAPSRWAPSRWLPPPLHLLPALHGMRYLSAADRYHIGRAIWRLMRTKAGELRSVTAAVWLDRQRQPAGVVRDFWEVIVISALGDRCDQVSMAAVQKVLVDGFLAARQASEIWVPQRPLGELFGQRLVGELRRRGVQICSGTAIRSVDLSEGQATDAALRLCLENESTAQRFDQVIVAVPGHQLHRVLSPGVAQRAGLDVQAWRSVPQSTISGVHLWFDRPITQLSQATLVGSGSQWVFRPALPGSDAPLACPDGGTPCPDGPLPCPVETSPRLIASRVQAATVPARHYYQVVISGSQWSRGCPADQLVDRVVADLRAVFPAASEAQLLISRVVSDPQAVFSLRPEVEAMRPPSSTALPCLQLAGDFVQTGWPATMEGAVISGRMAAATILRMMGRPACGVLPGLPAQGLSRWLVRRQ